MQADTGRGHRLRRVMVRYKVKPDQVARNKELVRAVYDELHRSQPGGLRYATLQAEDGVTFVHIAETREGHNPLRDVEAFARFQADIAARCDEPPVATTLREIGSFRFFGDEGAP